MRLETFFNLILVYMLINGLKPFEL